MIDDCMDGAVVVLAIVYIAIGSGVLISAIVVKMSRMMDPR